MLSIRQLSHLFSLRKLSFLLLVLLLILAITLVLRSGVKRPTSIIMDNFDDAAHDVRRFIKENVFDEGVDKIEKDERDVPEVNGDDSHRDDRDQWNRESNIDEDDSQEKNNGRAAIESSVEEEARRELKLDSEINEQRPEKDEGNQESKENSQLSKLNESEELKEKFKKLPEDREPALSQQQDDKKNRNNINDDHAKVPGKSHSNDNGAADPSHFDPKDSAKGAARFAADDEKPHGEHSFKRYEKIIKSEEEYRHNLDDMETVRRENEDLLPKHSYFGTHGNLNAHAICVASNSRRCVPKLQHSHTVYQFLPGRKLITCTIQKNMSSILRAILCYLTNPTKFIASGRVLTREVSAVKFCPDGNEFYNNEMNKIIPKRFHMTPMDMLDEWRAFVVIRDPFERFFSAYADKCIRKPTGNLREYCNGCRHNLTCFIISEYWNQINAHGWNPLTVESSKFFPQSWECNFNEYLSHFEFLQYRSADKDWNVDELTRMLGERGVEQKHLDYVIRSLKSNTTLHTTSGSRTREYLEERLRGSPFLMEFIVRMYYWDYILFNRTMPEVRFPDN